MYICFMVSMHLMHQENHNFRNKIATTFGMKHPQLSEQNRHNFRKNIENICIIHLFLVSLQRQDGVFVIPINLLKP